MITSTNCGISSDVVIKSGPKTMQKQGALVMWIVFKMARNLARVPTSTKTCSYVDHLQNGKKLGQGTDKYQNGVSYADYLQNCKKT